MGMSPMKRAATISVTAEIDETNNSSYHPQSDGIGVDLGVKSLAIVSDGRILKISICLPGPDGSRSG